MNRRESKNALTIKPISLKNANEYVITHHRHHDKVQGHKFSLSVWDGDRLCGVAIVGHPQSRMIDNDNILEVLRLCTDGTYNACSILYARCARIGKEMGYQKIITYILESELGTSLKASGWVCEEEKCGGFAWGGQREVERHQFEQMTMFTSERKLPPKEYKKRYAKILNEEIKEEQHDEKKDRKFGERHI